MDGRYSATAPAALTAWPFASPQQVGNPRARSNTACAIRTMPGGGYTQLAKQMPSHCKAPMRYFAKGQHDDQPIA
jgi:hypothetical protein